MKNRQELLVVRNRSWIQLAFACALLLSGGQMAWCQSALSPGGAHVLTNQVGTAHWAYFSVTLPAGYQGFVLTAENVSGTGPLELFVQSGAVNPTESIFLKRSVAGTRLLEMTAAELSPGEYRIGLLFQGAATNSTAQNRLRLIPILAPAGGALTNQVVTGRDLYFRVVATNVPTGLRALLSKTNHVGNELSVFRGERPEGATAIRNALGSLPETVWLTAAETASPTNFLLCVAGLAAGTNTVTLRWEPGAVTTLNWDPGTADGGTLGFTNAPGEPGGLRFFRLNPQASVVGAWRTVLRVTSGSAQFYMQSGSLPANPLGGAPGIFAGATSNSARLYYTGGYSAGQDWHITVSATPGSQWSLVSGEAFVQELGTVLPPDSDLANTTINTNTTAAIGPEGVRFFRTTVTNGTPAWRLWLNNGAASPVTLTNFIEVRQTQVPVPAAVSFLRQAGQMLVVPPDLNQANVFFLGVSGPEGTTLNLDSRVQRIEELAYGSNLISQAISGFRYRTFRVYVPSNSIAWQVTARTLSGDVDIALRRTEVGNETHYLARADATGTTSDSIALVPPTLSDGNYFITAYGKAASAFTLQQGSPVVTDIPFVNSTVPIPGYSCPTCTNGPVIVNDDPTRNGWRYYKVSDNASQLGVFGWLLSLSSQPPGTEIALRRNALPGRWSSGAHVDFSSTSGYLERQDHQADIWYVGIYSPVTALGAFQLETRPFVPTPVAIPSETQVTEVTGQRPASWEYFALDVPTTLTDSNLLGLEIQLTNASGNGLSVQMRRDQIPYGGGSFLSSANNTWPSGAFVGGGGDWTDRTRPWGNSDYLFLPMGWPLQPGRYYLGVRNDSAEPRSYGLRLATIGNTNSGKFHLIQPLAGDPGTTAGATNLSPREFRLYRFAVSNGTPNLRLQLNATPGEARFFLRRNQLPGLPGSVGDFAGIQESDVAIARIQRAGSEIVTILPSQPQTNLPVGDYFLLVAAEGTVTNYASANLGTGPTSYEFSILPPVTPVHLGSFGPGQELVISTNFTPPERRFFTLDILPGVKALDVRMENLTNNSVFLWANHNGLMQLSGGNPYGWIGGWGNYQRVTAPLQLIPPTPGRYSLVIESTTGSAAAHAARLTLTTQDSLPLAAADGDATVTNQPPLSWRFFQVDVPATAGGATPAAWDLKLVNVTNDAVSMAVARETFPKGLFGSDGFQDYLGPPSPRPSWPTNAQLVADSYLTRRIHGVAQYNKQMLLGWGWPVGAGTYFVGVFNSAAQPLSYQVQSRLVGGPSSTLPIKVEDLAWTGPGVLTTVSNLPAGEARFFRLPVPPGTPMFRLRLAQLRGEARLTIRRGSVPGTHLYAALFTGDDRGGMSFARVGDEEISALPVQGTNVVPAGDYYLTVISEGQNPPNYNLLGTNAVDFRLELLPDVQPVNFGALVLNQTVSITNITTWPNRAYGYLTIPEGARSLQINHQPLTNGSTLLLRPGTNLINGGGPGTPDLLELGTATWSGGESATRYIYGLDLWNKPPPGIYTLLLDSGTTTAAAVTSFTLSGETPLDFLNGETNYVQAPRSWRYFRVDVPTNAATELGVRGWEVRLADSPSDETWQMQIGRDELPPAPNQFSFVGDANTSWASGWYYGGLPFNWTGRRLPGMGGSGYFASMAWGRPLQPGTYYIGVNNASEQPRSIRLLTRAIGDAGSGLPIQIEPLSFGATLTVSNLPPGTLKYYRMTNLPPNLAGAKWKLRPLQGDARIHMRRGAVPGVTLLRPDGNPAGLGRFPLPGQQIGAAVPGNDYMIWWPESPDTTLPVDDYYFIVAAEGSPTNPDDGRLGTGPTSFEITSTAFIPEDLGQVTPNNPLTRDAAYDAGEPLAFNFDVPAGTRALEVRLENRVGNPVFELGRGTGHYGNFAGWFGNNVTNHLVSQVRYFVLPEPPADKFWLDAGQAGAARQAGSFRLSIHSLTNQPLNFSSLLNTNGQTNVLAASLADGQRQYLSVDIPETLAGEPILGWYLKLDRVQGNPQVRIRPGNTLPQPGNPDTSNFSAEGLVVAPPYFRPGHWIVEVAATGDSQFVLTSERVTLERPAWFLPPYGQSTTNANVTPPGFADSSILPDGSLLTNHVSLAQGRYHFYAVDVPEGNGGLLRAELVAHSGNSDLYVRAGQIPTLEAAHYVSFYGQIVGAYELALNSGAGSEFANWVPADTRREAQLTPGRWYFMVHAVGSNVRYQIKLGTGQVTELPLSGGSTNAQTLNANDWRYYRFVMPTNPPQFWDLTVAQQQGDVDVFLRDTAPPGVAYQVNPATWAREVKNAGVTSYLDYSTPGTWRFTTPQVRPGHVYYVGVRAVAQATFSISSSTSGPLLTQAFPDLDYIDPEGGSVSVTLNPFERRSWRVRVPDDAPRWKTMATNSGSVRLYLQNGSVPWASRDNPADHWSSSGANSQFEQVLNNRTNGGWPWVRGETFYVAATNELATAQTLYLRVDTRAWRLALVATNGTIQASPNKPYYDAGDIVNLTPQPAPGYRFANWSGDLSGTNQPGQITMTSDHRVDALFEPIPYHISITASNGAVQKNPDAPTYYYGSNVFLTAAPDVGYAFERWAGDVPSFENPLLIVVTGDRNVTAIFRQLAVTPTITLHPQNVSVAAGQTAAFTAAADGAPVPALRWQRSMDGGTSWADLSNSGGISGVTSGTLSISDTTTNMSGHRFRLMATNSAGSDISSAAILTVSPAAVAPTITLQPQNLTVTNGQPATFTAAADGTPAPSLQWQRSTNNGVSWTNLNAGPGISGVTNGILTISNAITDMNGHQFRLFASNSEGSISSTGAVLSVLAPATITHPPNHLTVAAAQPAIFSVTAIGTAPLSYEWFFSTTENGPAAPVSGATGRTLAISSASASHAGYYFIRVSNTLGTDESLRVVLTVIPPPSGFITRILPGGYLPAQSFEVLLEVRPDPNLFFYAVEETPPAGWAASDINEGGVFDPGTGLVRYAFFADNAVRTLRYTLIPPANATGRTHFSGVASADGANSPVSGADYLDPFLNHPADGDFNFRMTVPEVNAYGAAWLRGLSWPQPPNPIPIAYLTRAGFLSRNGEQYRLDVALGEAPAWWMPATNGALADVSFTRGKSLTAVQRVVQGNTASLEVPALPGVTVFAVQERLPVGFFPEEISHDGTFDAVAAMIRWGPFLDGEARTLSYRVHAPENFAGEIALAGTLSADGNDIRVSGAGIVSFGTAAPRRPVVSLAGDRLHVELHGPLNARVVVETAAELNGASDWELVTEFRLTQPGQRWSTPHGLLEPLRFYRIRLTEP